MRTPTMRLVRNRTNLWRYSSFHSQIIAHTLLPQSSASGSIRSQTSFLTHHHQLHKNSQHSVHATSGAATAFDLNGVRCHGSSIPLAVSIQPRLFLIRGMQTHGTPQPPPSSSSPRPPSHLQEQTQFQVQQLQQLQYHLKQLGAKIQQHEQPSTLYTDLNAMHGPANPTPSLNPPLAMEGSWYNQFYYGGFNVGQKDFKGKFQKPKSIGLAIAFIGKIARHFLSPFFLVKQSIFGTQIKLN
jgi:hypothetical protein